MNHKKAKQINVALAFSLIVAVLFSFGLLSNLMFVVALTLYGFISSYISMSFGHVWSKQRDYPSVDSFFVVLDEFLAELKIF